MPRSSAWPRTASDVGWLGSSAHTTLRRDGAGSGWRAAGESCKERGRGERARREGEEKGQGERARREGEERKGEAARCRRKPHRTVPVRSARGPSSTHRRTAPHAASRAARRRKPRLARCTCRASAAPPASPRCPRRPPCPSRLRAAVCQARGARCSRGATPRARPRGGGIRHLVSGACAAMTGASCHLPRGGRAAARGSRQPATRQPAT
eukprot:588104-Prymnesium_polylepis.1